MLMEATRLLDCATQGCAHGVVAGRIGIVDGERDLVTNKIVRFKGYPHLTDILKCTYIFHIKQTLDLTTIVRERNLI